MALESSFLAAENSAQERRSRSLYRFIVASPAVLIVAVGVVAHLDKPAYVGSAGDADYDKRVLAYRDRVSQTERLLSSNASPDPSTLEIEAKSWVAGYATGALRPLPPAAYEDHLRDGVRGEIVTTALALEGRMAILAQQSLRSGDVSQAVHRALLAAEVANPLSRSELIAVVQGLMGERRELTIVREAWSRVPAAEKPAFRARLEALKFGTDGLEALTALERSQIEDYTRRQKLPSIGEKSAKSVETGLSRRAGAARHGAKSHNARVQAILDLA